MKINKCFIQDKELGNKKFSSGEVSLLDIGPSRGIDGDIAWARNLIASGRMAVIWLALIHIPQSSLPKIIIFLLR